MKSTRMEAFSDGVLAIVITIMVLEMKVPHGGELSSLHSIAAIFGSYVLSFIYVAIYWNNHHHLLHAVEHVNGKVLWANTHLLFWLSLIPFGSGWMGENNFATWPVITYGFILMMAGVAYYILVRTLISLHGETSRLARAIGSDFKGKISVVLYAAAIGLSFIHTWFAVGIYIIVALIWIIPDKRIEKSLEDNNPEKY